MSATTPRKRPKILTALGFRNASAIWVLAVIVIVFSITIPRTFLAAGTWSSLLDTESIVAITSVALVIPLAAGVFNLAIGAQVGVSSIMAGWMLVNLGVPPLIAIPLTILIGAAIGLIIGFVVVRFRIDSFIATLGFSSLLAATVEVMSNGQQILNVPPSVVNFGTGQIFGLTDSFITMIVLCAVVWYVLERTAAGRRVYAVGGNSEAARLAGINVGTVVVGSLVACGLLCGVAGVLVTSRLGNADPTIGPAYLLPAFTAAFLGSTQFRNGRFNVWGTVLSVYVLAAGVEGLQLSGAPTWIPDAFNGLALLVAVGLASAVRLSGRPSLISRLRRRPEDHAGQSSGNPPRQADIAGNDQSVA